MTQRTSSKITSESGKREIHPYVRPGICTVLVGVTCFAASLVAHNATSKYDRAVCENVKVFKNVKVLHRNYNQDTRSEIHFRAFSDAGAKIFEDNRLRRKPL